MAILTIKEALEKIEGPDKVLDCVRTFAKMIEGMLKNPDAGIAERHRATLRGWVQAYVWEKRPWLTDSQTYTQAGHIATWLNGLWNEKGPGQE